MLENMDFTQGMCHHFHPKFKSVILLSELLISFKISSENLRVCQYPQFKCSDNSEKNISNFIFMLIISWLQR